MSNELEQHKISDKIKWILTLCAFVLVGVMITGIICGWFTKKDEKPETDETATFTVTPQNTASKMKLTAMAYSGDDEISAYAETYTLVATTKYYSGAVSWSVAWTGDEVYWNSAEKTESVDDCITLTTIDERSVRVECLQPFGQKIAITAALVDKPSVKEICVCDYKQTYVFDELQIGFNTFRKDGTLGIALINVDMGIAPAPVSLNGTQTLDYAVNTVSSSYTKVGTEASGFPEISFTLTPNAEVVAAFGLDKYSFGEYTGSFENAATGTLAHFFDRAWCAHAVSGTSFTVNDFAADLCNSVNAAGFGIDSANLYTLTLNGLPEADGSVTYGYRVDIYDLMQLVADMATLTLNQTNMTFGG